MSFEHIPGIGMVHFLVVKPPRIVPGHERHKWNSKPRWGESATCLKCGCVKYRNKPEYSERTRCRAEHEPPNGLLVLGKQHPSIARADEQQVGRTFIPV